MRRSRIKFMEWAILCGLSLRIERGAPTAFCISTPNRHDNPKKFNHLDDSNNSNSSNDNPDDPDNDPFAPRLRLDLLYTHCMHQLSSGAVLENSFCMRKDQIASAQFLLSMAMEQEKEPETLQFIQQIFVLIRPFCEQKQEKLLKTEGILSIPSLSLMLTYLCHNRARPLLTINLTQTLVVV